MLRKCRQLKEELIGGILGIVVQGEGGQTK